MTDAQNPVTLAGQISAVTYASPRSGYGVVRVRAEEGGEVTVVGYLPDPAPGERIEAGGVWTTHPQYGPQFKAQTVRRTMPADTAAIVEYLSSRVVPGVGPVLAARLTAHFGAETLTVMSTAPQRLSEVSGITARRAAAIGEAFATLNHVRRLIEFLSGHGLPPHLAARLTERFGNGAVEAVSADPYLLVADPFFVPFSRADELALALGFEGDDPRRARAAVLYELMENAGEGHVFLPEDKLIDSAHRFIHVEEEPLYAALSDLIERGDVVRDGTREKAACYLTELYEAETAVAEKIAAMTGPLTPPRRLEALVEEVQGELGVDCAAAQREALFLAARSRVMLLTGGPGTGKTTTLRAMLALFDRMGLSCALAAPTGRAAKRMGELTGREAKTLHRLLEVGFDPESGQQSFLHGGEDPLDADVAIVDEMSMVDILLMRALLEALRPEARLVMVGDPDQLPSVGPGQVLADLLASGRVPSVRLHEVFRQAGESRIVRRAHEVNRGEVEELRRNEGDFFFLSRRNPQEALGTILELCAERLPKNLGIPPSSIQVISPTRLGVTGTASINRHMREALNPPERGRPEYRFGDTLFRVGDRVMQVKNNYDLMWKQDGGSVAGLGVFNGDTGVLLDMDTRAELAVVRFDDRLVTYTFDQLGELEPAWAMTVHKAQGSEYPAVVLAALPGPPMLQNRRVLYTALTRAREYMIVVGDEAVVRAMAKNNRDYGRYGRLKARLCEESL